MWVKERRGQETNPSHRATDAASPPPSALSICCDMLGRSFPLNYLFFLAAHGQGETPGMLSQAGNHLIPSLPVEG